jgi:hypothetical protein
MNKPRDPAAANPPTTPAIPAGTPASSSATPQSGRVQFDARGNAVWEWRTEAGEFSADINTQRLKKLEASDLSIEQTGKVKKIDGLSMDETFSGKGFNPYDHAKSQPKSPDPYQKRYNTAASADPKAPARKPIKDLKAYSEWLAMKKRLAEQKDKD